MCGIFGVSEIPDAARSPTSACTRCSTAGRRAPASSRWIARARPGAHRGMGLVAENVRRAGHSQHLPGDVAVGHTRYSTAGSSVLANAQPCLANYRGGPARHRAQRQPHQRRRAPPRAGGRRARSSRRRRTPRCLVHLIARSEAPTIEGQIRDALEQVEGAYSLVITRRAGRSTPSSIRAASVRWCSAGSASGIVVASETCALDLVGATIDPRAAAGRVRPHRGRRGRPTCRRSSRRAGQPLRVRAGLLRPARQHVFGESVDRVRRELGRQLAREHPAPGAEVVFSVPDSSNAMALGFAEVSGIKLEHGLIRNHYVGRTFINPTQALRVAKVKIKFNPVREVIEGKLGGDGGRQPGARHHQQGPGADDPRRRRPRGAPPARLAADHRALPLRHRHADPRGADRRHPLDRGDPRLPRRRLARLPLARRHAPCRGHAAPDSATPASRASTRRRSRTNWSSCGTPLRSPPRSHDRLLHASRSSTSSARAAPTAPPP